MHALEIGDSVHVGGGQYSEVFMFTHRKFLTTEVFTQLWTSSGKVLTASPGHYVYANDALVTAGSVVAGDTLEFGSGSKTVVLSKSYVQRTGLYNPQTIAGDIVVDNFKASCYTSAVEPNFAHAVLAPLRAAYNLFGLATRAIEEGSHLASALPDGAYIVI